MKILMAIKPQFIEKIRRGAKGDSGRHEALPASVQSAKDDGGKNRRNKQGVSKRPQGVPRVVVV